MKVITPSLLRKWEQEWLHFPTPDVVGWDWQSGYASLRVLDHPPCCPGHIGNNVASPLACFHNDVRKSESWGADASHKEGDERNAIRKSSAARLCRWPEGAEEKYQERITDFSVIMRSV